MIWEPHCLRRDSSAIGLSSMKHVRDNNVILRNERALWWTTTITLVFCLVAACGVLSRPAPADPGQSAGSMTMPESYSWSLPTPAQCWFPHSGKMSCGGLLSVSGVAPTGLAVTLPDAVRLSAGAFGEGDFVLLALTASEPCGISFSVPVKIVDQTCRTPANCLSRLSAA